MSNRPQKVLILALSGIGNLLMQFPTINALKKAHPNWYITVWVDKRGTRELAEHNPNIDEIIELPIKNSLLGHLKTCYLLRSTYYSMGIMLSPGQLLKGALIMFAAGIPVRIGHRYPFSLLPRPAKPEGEVGIRGARGVSWFLTHSIDEQPNLHDIEQNLNLLTLIENEGSPTTDHKSPITNHYSLTIPLSNQRAAEELASNLKIPATKNLLGLHAGAAKGFEFKRWPLENFSELARHFINKNYHILIFGGPDEAELKEKLRRLVISPGVSPSDSPGVVTGSSITIVNAGLLTTAAIMQKCELFVSNDSGLMHLAAAAGVKTFGLFGPTNEALTGPRGRDSRVIRAPGTRPVYSTERNNLNSKEANETIRSLASNQVIDYIEEML